MCVELATTYLSVRLYQALRAQREKPISHTALTRMQDLLVCVLSSPCECAFVLVLVLCAVHQLNLEQDSQQSIELQPQQVDAVPSSLHVSPPIFASSSSANAPRDRLGGGASPNPIRIAAPPAAAAVTAE